MFNILIAVRNARPYIEKCLLSASYQDWDPRKFRIHVTDDASDDGTLDVIHSLEWSLSFRLTANTERRGALANYHSMIQRCEDDDVVLLLDGDDMFPHAKVLERLAREYADPNVWMTYGSFAYDEISRLPTDTEGRGFAAPVPPHAHTRRSGWRSTHLKTFYAWLFRKIRESDFKRDGKWIDPAWDLPIMYPMIEMATAKHARYIHDILYIYNLQNPFNDVKLYRDEQTDMAKYVESQPIYAPLKSRNA